MSRNPKTTEYLKECISDAIIQLIKEKPIEKITADEIADKAQVGRATFFRSFSSKTEAVTFKFIKLWERYAIVNDLKVRDKFDLNNALHFFEYNYSIRHVLDTVYAAGLQSAVHDSFYRIMLPENSKENFSRNYREKFYAHGLYGLLDEWIKRKYKETPEEMAKILIGIVKDSGYKEGGFSD